MKKGAKIAGTILGSLLVVCLLGMLLANSYGPERLLTYAKERVRQTTQGRYELRLDTLDFNVFTLSVYLGDLRFQRDTSTDNYSGISLLDEHDLTIQFDDLTVDYFNLLRYVLRNEIKVDYFALTHPQFEIRQNPDYHPAAKREDSTVVDSTLLQDFTDSTASLMPTLLINKLKLEGASFAFYEAHWAEPLVQMKGFSATLRDLSSSADAPVSSEELSLRLDTLSAWVGHYTARVEVFGFSAVDTLLAIDSLHYGHVVSPQRLNEIRGFRASKLDVQAKDLAFRGMDYDLFLADTGWVFRRIEIGFVDFLLEKDQNEERINPQYKSLPTEALMESSLVFRIDTAVIRRARVRVAMQAPGAKAPGRLFLSQIRAHITNINHGPSIAENPQLRAHAEAYLMGEGQVNLNYRFPLDAGSHAFFVDGSLGPMSFEALNPFVSGLAFLRFASGRVNGMTFDFSGNESHTEGTLRLEYEDLKLAKLEDFQAVVDKNPRNGLLIGLANLIVPTHHLSTKRSYKPGEIYWEREYNRDIVHYSLQSLISGIISNLGFGPKNPEKAAERKKRREVKKREREDRKRERQEEKDLRRKERKEAREKKKNG